MYHPHKQRHFHALLPHLKAKLELEQVMQEFVLHILQCRKTLRIQDHK